LKEAKNLSTHSELKLKSYLSAHLSAADPKQRTDFTLLMKELYAQAKPAGLEVSAAVRAAANAGENFELGEIHKYVDFLNLMSYDYNGGAWSPVISHNAPLLDCGSRWCGKEWDIDSAVSTYLKAGVPPSKIILGLATYGRSFQLRDTSVPGNPAPWTQAGAGEQLV
jgi:chitinase